MSHDYRNDCSEVKAWSLWSWSLRLRASSLFLLLEGGRKVEGGSDKLTPAVPFRAVLRHSPVRGSLRLSGKEGSYTALMGGCSVSSAATLPKHREDGASSSRRMRCPFRPEGATKTHSRAAFKGTPEIWAQNNNYLKIKNLNSNLWNILSSNIENQSNIWKINLLKNVSQPEKNGKPKFGANLWATFSEKNNKLKVFSSILKYWKLEWNKS